MLHDKIGTTWKLSYLDIWNIRNYIILEHKTIRWLAEHYSIPVSTMHRFLHSYAFIEFLGYAEYENVCAQLTENFCVKHIRGGKATRNKYLKEKENNKDATVV